MHKPCLGRRASRSEISCSANCGSMGWPCAGEFQQRLHLVAEALQQFVVPLEALFHEVARLSCPEVGDHLHIGNIGHAAPAL